MTIDVYADYINQNADNIANEVNDTFEKTKDFLKVKLIHELRSILTPIPEHFEWKYDGNPYDFSGEIFEKGYISLDQTVNEFLENEYTGGKIATYVSHMGFRFITYGETLSDFTLDIGAGLMRQVIKQTLEKEFNTTITDDELFDIAEKCSEFDEIYDNCLASDFFWAEGACDFCGIGDTKLSKILRKDKKQWGS